MTADFVEYEAKRALEWLQSTDARNAESRKLASVLILRELAENAPTLFYPHASAFFAHVSGGLTDSKLHIRENAAKALHSCLLLVAARRSRNREAWFSSLYNWCWTMLQTKSGAPEIVHGALLTLGELLANTGAALTPRFNDICELVLKYREHKDKLVRRTVIVLLPRLAHFHPETFVRAFAELALAHLLMCLKDAKQVQERGIAYVAVGRIALAIGAHLASDALRPYLERIAVVVKDGLTPGVSPGTTLGVTRGRVRPFVPEALTCVAMLARAVGPSLMEYMHDIIDPMFSDGLSVMLTETLQAVADAIPALKPLLQERLLHELSLILANRPFTPPFADPTPAFASASSLTPAGASNVGIEDYMSLLAPYGLVPGLAGDDIAAAAVTAAAAGDGGGPSPAAWNAYGVLTATGLPQVTRDVASRGGSASAALASLAALISAGPPTPSVATPGAAGGNMSGAGGYGASGAAVTGLPVTVMTPTTMSWARHMPSASMGSSSGVDGPSGSMGASASGVVPGSTSYDSAGIVLLATTRGIPNDVICLCLHTLGTFDFAGVPLLPFAREVVMAYVDADDAAVRLEAALACCRLMVRPTDIEGTSVDPLLVNAGLDTVGDDASDASASDDDSSVNSDEDEEDDEEEQTARASADSPLHRQRGMESKHADGKAGEAGRDTPASKSDPGVATSASLLRDDVDGLTQGQEIQASTEVQRRRRIARETRRYFRRLRPPYHPLLVYGTDSVATMLGMGAHTSPVALALAGYSGGLADVGAQVRRAGLTSRLERIARRGAGRAYDGSFLGSITAVIGTGPTLLMVSQLLQRLIMMSLTDPDPAVRFELLAALDSRFDALLVEQNNLRLLFQGLQDENFACREGFLALLGRLVAHNPAYILPAVRRTLLAVLAELEYTDAHPDPAPLSLRSSATGAPTAAASGTRAGGMDTGVSTRGGPISAAASASAAAGTRGSLSEYADGDGPPAAPGAGLASSIPAAARINAYHSGVAHDVVLATAAGGGGREHAARMLGLLIRSCQRLVAPYVPVILRSLLPHAWAISPSRALLVGDTVAPINMTLGYLTGTAHPDVLTTCILAALGELSAVGADVMLPYMPVVLPLVVEAVTQGAHSLGIMHGVMTTSSTTSASSTAIVRATGVALNDMTEIDAAAGGGLGGNVLTGAAAAGVVAVGANAGGGNAALFGGTSVGNARLVASAAAPAVTVLAVGDPLLFTEVAIRTLGLLIENTGQVIIPYLDHPHLLQMLLASLARPTPFVAASSSSRGSSGTRRENVSANASAAAQWSLRREVMRTMGILGALDPYRHRMAQIAQAQRAAAAAQTAVQARLAAAIASAKARGRRIAGAGLTPSVLSTGMRPGAGVPFILYEDGSSGVSGHGDGDVDAVILNPDGTAATGPWALHSHIPQLTGVAVGGGVDVDPMEAAMAGLAGEAGANVGINLDEVGIGMGQVGALTLGMGGGDARLAGAPLGLDMMYAPAAIMLGGGGGSRGADGEGGGAADGASGDGPLDAVASMPAAAILPSMVSNSEDFHPTVALTALLSILSDETLALHHNNVLQAIMLIFRSLGTRCVSFLPRVVPAFLAVLKTAAAKARTQGGVGASALRPAAGVVGGMATTGGDLSLTAYGSTGADAVGGAAVADNSASLRDTVLQQLAALVTLVRHAMRPWLPAIFALLRDVWPASLPALLRLVEATAGALGVEAKPFLATLVPHMLSVLTHDGVKAVFASMPSAALFQQDIALAGMLGTTAGGRFGDVAGGAAGAAGGTPPASRLNTRHVLHTLAVLVCGGRRALWGGHRHLLDDHFDLFVPAITRLVDAGVGAVNAPAGGAYDDDGGLGQGASGAAGSASATGGSAAAAASAASGGAAGSGGTTGSMVWMTTGGIPSCSSSLAAYGPVAPLARRQAIDTLAAMAAGGVDLTAYAGRLIHALARVIADVPSNTPPDVKRAAVDALCLLMLQLGEDYVPWIPTVRKACALATLAASGATGADGSSLTASAAGATGSGSTPGLSSAGVVGAVGAAMTDMGDAERGGGAAAGGLGAGAGGVGGTGPGSAVRHETYERLVSLLLGFGTGYGYVGDDSLALYGYGAPLALPTNPVDLAALLYDPGMVADESGPRIASALALSNTGGPLPVATPAFGGSVLDGVGGAAPPPGSSVGLLGALGADADAYTIGMGSLGNPALLSLASGDGAKKLQVNQETLKRAWETNARSTKEDWTEWMRRFSVDLLRESPSPALRSCWALAQVYSPLAADLFNAAFVAVWAELYDEYQDSLVQALETAFNSETIPTSILQSLLNLAEFMEHDEKALPIDVRILGQLAERVGAFAKALHYKEMEFHTSPASCIESLISINNQLDQPEAAVGILKFAQQQAHGIAQYGYRASHQVGPTTGFTAGDAAAAGATSPSNGDSGAGSGLAGLGIAIDVQETWYEKLGRWEDALEAYERKQVEAPNSLSLVLGRMRCLKALGEWQRLDDLSRETWPRLSDNDAGKQAVAPHAARAAWALGRWLEMEEYISCTNEYSLQGAFFRAVLSIHGLNFTESQRYIDRARKVLAAEFAAMGNEPYSRGYRRMVTVQQLSEMEEILTYLRLQAAGNAPGADTYIRHVRNMWGARLRGAAKNVDVWNRVLSVRSLVTIASENMNEWLQFAGLCRRNGRLNMSLKVLMGLGMDGGGGMSNAVARYLTGQGSIHSHVPTLGNNSGRGTATGRLISATMSASLGVSVPPVMPPAGVAVAALSARADDRFNPMLLPDHPYQPYEFDFRSTQHTIAQATSRVGAHSAAHPRVMYAYLKHLWGSGHRSEAVDQLSLLTRALDDHSSRRSRVVDGRVVAPTVAADGDDFEPGRYGMHVLTPEDEAALRVQCHLRLGQWQQTLAESQVSSFATASMPASARADASPVPDAAVALTRGQSVGSATSGSTALASRGAPRMPSDAYASAMAPVLLTLHTATHECAESGYGHYRAWHAWALVNFAAAEHHYDNFKTERERERVNRAVPGTSAAPGADGRRAVTSTAIMQAVTAHAVAAVKAFFRSIALGRTRLKAYVLQDLLRLLTLWFTHGELQPVRAALEAGLASAAVSIEVWLQVIPQLIARIHVQAPATRRLLHSLLMQIGKVHPQALVYPLTVACKSASLPRHTAATTIVGSMRRLWNKLVDQAEMVSRELIRVAILWHEMWHSGLEEASRQYFGDNNVEGMLETLLPLHQMMTTPGPQTARETSFAQTFAADLARAHRWLEAYRSNGRVGDLSQAWDVYYHVFRKINKMLPTMMNLELQFVSPILLSAHDLELSVPGTYSASSPVTTITAFSPSIDVMSSKQRPRKVTLLGSDGRQYTFLLKGHEDLRQDERVMQLFGLVNTLLANDSETSRRDLSIRRYAVTPLSHNAGVVGWVPNCDTLHALIREYRENRKVLLNIEHRLMVQMAPMYDALTLLQKVEVFRYALDNTTGQDLYKVLWLKSSSSEVWLDRRTNYTRSLAVMSIVGYILGLGDRHPSNLMLDRVSGKILHIDFGDCLAEDHEILTNRGFMGLPEVAAHFMEEDFRVAGFDATAQRIVYEQPSRLIVNAPRQQEMMEFTQDMEAQRWEPDNVFGESRATLGASRVGGGAGADSTMSVSVDELTTGAAAGAASAAVDGAVSAAGKKRHCEEAAVQGAHSNYVSLMVTPSHDMYARVGSHSGNMSYFPSSTFRKAKAASLRGAVKFQCAAVGGAECIPVQQLPFVAQLSLQTPAQVRSFLQLYGFWLGAGHLEFVNASSAPRAYSVGFYTVKDAEFLEDCFRALGLAAGEWLKTGADDRGAYHVQILRPSYVKFFQDEYSGKYKARGGSSTAEAAAVVGAAPYNAVDDAPVWELVRRPTPVRPPFIACPPLSSEGIKSAKWFMCFDGQEHGIFTSSTRFRDEIMRLALHAGYAPYFTLINQNTWRVAYADTLHGGQHSEPTLVVDRDVRRVPYVGRTWCVTMPHTFIIARRAVKQDGVVIKASRPVIMHNCFEVAMTRDKFPERVPFRLTRMLMNAMEVSGIEGNYRSTCEAVMRVMRQHRDSAMAMLEAFVHDPLINWRLLTGGGPGAAPAGAPAAAGGADAPTEPAAPPTRAGARRGSVGVVGAARPNENDPEARPLLQRGLQFAAEAEAANIAHVVAETGFQGPIGGADGADANNASHAMARSLATSARRGDRERELMQALGPEGTEAPSEALNERAIAVTRRIQAKLTGRDFAEDDPIGRVMSMNIGLSAGMGNHTSDAGALDVAAQVQRLICAATSTEALACCYLGWCPWW